MNRRRIPSLVLALVLQVAPVCRVACTQPALATPTFAIVARCAAAIAALLGGVDAVSGASVPVYVAGVQSLLPSLPGVRTNITGRVGSPMVLRIILGGSVGQEPQLDFYNATPLPPGLIINTNVNTNSLGLESTNYYIYGTPLAAGVWYPVTVSAGNLLYPTVASTNILITITNASGGSPPTIVTHPRSLTVTNGAAASFSVVASGVSSYQWRKNGLNLSGATSAIYSIPATTTNDAAGYAVVASNASGSVTSLTATLTVLVPPAITTPPQSLTVSNGDTASFQVVAAGLPPPTFQWRFNGNVLEGATAATLVITNAQSAHEGDYSVVASNVVGTTVSAPAHLSVRSVSSPPQLLRPTIESGAPAFDVSGPANTMVVVLLSTDFSTWTPMATNSSPSGTWHFLDTLSSPSEARFYRARILP
jgi:hypothetical protein